ncbi:hydantoinase/oxoprolinase family protein [Halobium salinum]|uniref:Hydantoinase/oxoprolinase family protein n=1 Tax=Halobium salinum TaxID=1364940 RepID=A0ABD5PJA4_9EURY|nr:hydantoinase/oxoprolinase family protein [Halobium salinum]
MYRLGIDSGGTFTDFVLAGDGDVSVYKTPSTPDDPAQAVKDGLALVADDLDTDVPGLLADIDIVIHGTTVATNALIEHTGAKVGLLCTEGHEDSLEIRLGHKEDGHRYDMTYPMAEMLVPRHLRVPVGGRVLSDGSEHAPLDEADVYDAVERLREADVDAVAVSLVWSFENPSHEERVREILAEELPGVHTSFSVDVLPQVREYTRTSTTVVNAYVKPTLDRYVERVEGYLQENGFEGQTRYIQANGGITSSEGLRERPAYAINSGPAGGPAAGRHLGAKFGSEDVITVDMGGTSFDVSLTKDGSTEIRKDFDLMRYRMGLPMLQVETIGAGGGSVASLDRGVLTVGPESAGADPGPACYDRGGTKPTTTDALVVLGYLNQEELLGGRMKIDADASRRAIEGHVAADSQLDVESAAAGILEIVNKNMVDGIRQVSIEKGHDPRDFAMVVGGGAGPAHATGLADELGIGRVLVPKTSSVLCAYGEVVSNYKHNRLASYPSPVEAIDPADLEARFAELEAEGVGQLRAEGIDEADISLQRVFEMRYRNQIKECEVTRPATEITDEWLSELREAFDERHEELYTYAEPETGVDLINVESVAIGRVDPPDISGGLPTGDDAETARVATREAYFEETDGFVETPVYDGSAIPVDVDVEGPAVVEEDTTTIVVNPGWSARLDDSGVYELTR